MRLPGPDLLGLVFGGSEIALSIFKRSRGAVVRADSKSLRVLWGTVLASVALAVMAAALVPTAHSPILELLYPLGLALFVSGLALRWWAIAHLGRFFTVDVAIAEDHRVVDDGPYRYVRHPSYAGVLLAFVGYGVCVGNWLSLALVTIPIALAFARRIQVEETALRTSLGEAYCQYAARTRRLVPMLY